MTVTRVECKICGRPECTGPYENGLCYEVAYVRLVGYLREVPEEHLSYRARQFLRDITP